MLADKSHSNYYIDFISATEENKRLKAEIEELKAKLEAKSPLLSLEEISNEELICLEQLDLLKKQSSTRELTLEETRKAEIWSKMLISIRDKQRNEDDAAKGVKIDELLKTVENDAPAN